MKWLMELSQTSLDFYSLPLRKGKRLFISLVALMVTVSVLSGCTIFPKEAEEEVLPTIQPPKLSKKPVYTVGTATIEQSVTGGGKVMSLNEQTMYFTEDGKRIKMINVHSGDLVKKGQVLAELDMEDAQNQYDQKKLETRKDELQMIDLLRKSDEMDPAQVEQAKIDFELKRTELRKLEKSLAHAKIMAPFDGTVVSVTPKNGDQINAYSPVMVVSDLSKLCVAVTFDADDLKKIAPKMKADIDINGVGKQTGTVLRMPLKPNNSNMYNPGYDQFGNPLPDSPDIYTLISINPFPKDVTRDTPLSASVVVQRHANVVVIEPSVLRTHAGRNYVIVQDEQGNKREVDVEIGLETATQIEIVRGLDVGQRVVGR